MKNAKTTRRLACLLAAIAVGSAGYGGASMIKKALADNAPKIESTVGEGWTIAEFEVPSFGQTVTFPAASVVIDGVSVDAVASVRTPDGRNLSGSSFVADTAGEYVISFVAQANGKIASTEKTFKIDAPFVTVGAKSSATVGKSEKYGSSKNNEGYLLRVAENETALFNEPINVKNLTHNDTLLSMFIIPDTLGVADVDRLRFTFTDAVYPEIYFTFEIGRVVQNTWPGSDTLSYSRAGANGQKLTGTEGDRLHVENQWGTCVGMSFTAQNDSSLETVVPSDRALRLSYDAESKVLNANGAIVADFDDTKYFSNTWSGFKSGKARLSVSALGYSSQTANICVTSVYGLDFAQTTVTDVEGPNLEIETTYDKMPAGALNEFYPIPDAIALDEYSGKVNVERKVVYSYGLESSLTVEVKNGGFIPKYDGRYTVVYTATDNYGNATTKTLTIDVGKTVPDIVIDLPEYGDFVYGQYVDVKDAQASGGSGNLEVTAKAIFDGEEVEAVDGKVKLDRVGEWKVVYTAVDYLGRKTEREVVLNVTASDAPVFAEKPVLPIAMIDGYEYDLNEYFAEDYSTGVLVKKLCSAKIVDASGDVVVTTGETYAPSVLNDGDKITITYVADGIEGLTVEVPVVKARIAEEEDPESYLVDVSKYFYGDVNVDVTSYATIEATADGDSSWSFVNSLVANTFSIKVSTIPDATDFRGLRFTLSDVADADNAVSMTLEIIDGKTYMVSGSQSALLSFTLADKSGVSTEVSYLDGAFAIGNVKVVADTKDNGYPFVGFSSEKVNLTVTALDAAAGAKYNVREISLHSFNSFKTDFTSPVIYVDGTYGGSYDINDVISIPRVYAFDVLAPKTDVVMTVYKPNGEIATDKDGVKLDKVSAASDISIRLTEYGQYKVSYRAEEIGWWGRSRSFQYMINVSDGVAPTITLNGGDSVCKKGDVYRLPSYVVSDDIASAENIAITITVLNPNGKIVRVNGNSFKFAHVGKYSFRILAIDETGNATIKKWTVTVTA